ncbi:hypothetical protein NIES4071_87150 [Calothrix sp. NIES-4071]|nr:hypothetical protein NIES4071_87150 [Calothrix sp. NIES-4071]BAZ62982.1 hypothetical protein NIES4105_87080 [Calothrix sp. NIES-4105]
MTPSFSPYMIMKTTVKAGKIRHVKGTKIAGRNDADIVKIPSKLNYDSLRAYCNWEQFFTNSQDF